MLVRRSLISLGPILVAAACADSLSPRRSIEPTPHFLQWAPTARPQFSAQGATSEGGLSSGGRQLLLSGPADLSLTQYQASFWAVRGKLRSLQINYLDAAGSVAQPFLRLTTYSPRYVPGRGDIGWGDSVLVTVTVDPSDFAVDLQPTGLQFDFPAPLQIWYGGAAGDLNGDGVVNSTDADIESQLLGMWYQADPTSLWSPLPATQSLSTKSFTAALQHFSGYSVAW